MKNKGTKRLLSLVVMVIIMISTTLITVSADTVRDYKIQEIGLKISLPAYMNVITRETSTNDEVYEKYGTSGKDLTDLDMYLVAYSADATQTLTVTVTEDKNSKKVNNYNTLSESQLNTIKNSYQKDEDCESCSIENYNNLVPMLRLLTQCKVIHWLTVNIIILTWFLLMVQSVMTIKTF